MTNKLLVYHRNAAPPIVDLTLSVADAVALCEALDVPKAEAKTAANRAIGRHRVSPKRAHRENTTIYFYVSFYINKTIFTTDIFIGCMCEQ